MDWLKGDERRELVPGLIDTPSQPRIEFSIRPAPPSKKWAPRPDQEVHKEAEGLGGEGE
jgi:hypothetical protein